MKAESKALIQQVNMLYSLNEDLFSVAQSLFDHVGVGQTHRHADRWLLPNQFQETRCVWILASRGLIVITHKHISHKYVTNCVHPHI